MSVWELAMVGSLAGFVLWPSVTGLPRRPLGWIPILAAAGALLIHVRVETIRWQLYPIYMLVVILSVATAWEIVSPTPESPEPPRGRVAQLGKGLSGVLGIGVLVIPTLVLPVVQLVAPTTPIGTMIMRSVSPDRVELYGPNPGGFRQITLQIWYPSEPSDGALAPFVDSFDDFAPATAAYLGLPPFALNHLRNATMGSVLDASVARASEPYPVVVYSHGWAGFRTVAFPQAEALAAAGYVVVAIDHTYGALGATIDEGATFAALDPLALPDQETVGDAAYAAASETLVDIFRLDIGQALAAVEDLNAGGPMAGRLDLSRIGVFGHSTGGGAAIEFCATDDRCSAVYGLDPWVEPVSEAILAGGVQVPIAILRSEAWLSDPNEIPLAALREVSPDVVSFGCITGTAHRDFTLLPRLSPLSKYLGIGGSLDPIRSSELVESQLVSFFDRFLKGEGDGLAGLDAPEIAGCR